MVREFLSSHLIKTVIKLAALAKSLYYSGQLRNLRTADNTAVVNELISSQFQTQKKRRWYLFSLELKQTLHIIVRTFWEVDWLLSDIQILLSHFSSTGWRNGLSLAAYSWINNDITNKYARPHKTRTEMYAGESRALPWWVTLSIHRALR